MFKIASFVLSRIQITSKWNVASEKMLESKITRFLKQSSRKSEMRWQGGDAAVVEGGAARNHSADFPAPAACRSHARTQWSDGKVMVGKTMS